MWPNLFGLPVSHLRTMGFICPSDLHGSEKTQRLLPLSTLFTSTDGCSKGDYIQLNFCMALDSWTDLLETSSNKWHIQKMNLWKIKMKEKWRISSDIHTWSKFKVAHDFKELQCMLPFFGLFAGRNRSTKGHYSGLISLSFNHFKECHSFLPVTTWTWPSQWTTVTTWGSARDH